MSKQVLSPELDGPLDLKDPFVAAFLAWLIPGLGHLYQGRTGKGLLYMVCILGTFSYGLFALGEGRAVYASWNPDPPRLAYLCQVGVGLPALPAVVQAMRTRANKPQLWGRLMAPPRYHQMPGDANADNLSLHELHVRLHRYLELATVYTMIAGLLNLLVIYDAWEGPLYLPESVAKPDDDEQPGPPPDAGPAVT